MAHGHEQRPGVRSGTQCRTDDLAIDTQIAPGTPLRRQIVMFTDQSSLGGANGRQTGQDTEMAGNAEPSGVSQSLAVAQHQVWHPLQTLECGQYGRHFAKRKESRYIGESHLPPGDGSLDDVQVWKIQNRNRGSRDRIVLLETDIDSGDQTYRVEPVLGNDLVAQGKLYIAGAVNRYCPGVAAGHTHAPDSARIPERKRPAWLGEGGASACANRQRWSRSGSRRSRRMTTDNLLWPGGCGDGTRGGGRRTLGGQSACCNHHRVR